MYSGVDPRSKYLLTFKNIYNWWFNKSRALFYTRYLCDKKRQRFFVKRNWLVYRKILKYQYKLAFFVLPGPGHLIFLNNKLMSNCGAFNLLYFKSISEHSHIRQIHTQDIYANLLKN
jgi:hypothetical protein